GTEDQECRDLTFRNNVVYDCESHGVQFNNYGTARNRRILFENNIFGPTRANCFNGADPVDGFTFRHNTFVPGTREYTSAYRTITCGNTTFRVSDTYTDVAVYNNILHTFTFTPKDDWHVGFNLYQSF